jgi:23S rRNA (uridine2552-2'-O)-methyltransferase
LKKFQKKNLSHSSKLWLTRQLNDPLVAEAKKQNYRSRAIFKFLEINDKCKFLKNNLKIIDLGAAPGSWSQYVSKVNKDGTNIALDLLNIKPINNCKFIKGDFTSKNTQENLIELINGSKFDIVLSDIAENSTGNRSLDSMRSNIIAIEVMNFSLECLKKNGVILIKTFSGVGNQEVVEFAKKNFSKHLFIKPKSSRKDSKELYLYCVL